MASDEPPGDSTSPENPEVLEGEPVVGPGEKWITIWKARNGPEANVAMLALQARGVPARVDFESTASLGAWAGAGPGTATGVQVLATDAQTARGIIEELEQTRAARREEEGPKCPRCGKPSPKRVLAPPRIAGLILIALAVLMTWLAAAFCVPLGAIGVFLLTWPVMPKWRCRSCGQTWRASEPEDVDDKEEAEEGGDVP